MSLADEFRILVADSENFKFRQKMQLILENARVAAQNGQNGYRSYDKILSSNQNDKIKSYFINLGFSVIFGSEFISNSSSIQYMDISW